MMVAPGGGCVLDASEPLPMQCRRMMITSSWRGSPDLPSMSVPARMTMTAGAAGACAKLAATNAMVEIAASMYRIRTSWELGGHHTSSNAKTENWKPRTGNQELETKNWQLFPVGKTVLSS